MKHKIETLTNFLTQTISGWSNVECITVDPRSEIFAYDPYFAVVIDVYHRGKIPSARDRRNAFGDPGAFESSAGRTKDRFFLEELPIRIEYKDVRAINLLVNRPLKNIKLLKNSGTYAFFRLMNNKVILDVHGWIGQMRKALATFPNKAWKALRDNYNSKMEHYLSDMGAASFSGDKFFLLLSEAEFLRYAAASIFAANMRFEPSHRDIEEHLRNLASIPEDFWTSWDAVLQKEGDQPASKRFEIARILAGKVISFH